MIQSDLVLNGGCRFEMLGLGFAVFCVKQVWGFLAPFFGISMPCLCRLMLQFDSVRIAGTKKKAFNFTGTQMRLQLNAMESMSIRI